MLQYKEITKYYNKFFNNIYGGENTIISSICDSNDNSNDNSINNSINTKTDQENLSLLNPFNTNGTKNTEEMSSSYNSDEDNYDEEHDKVENTEEMSIDYYSFNDNEEYEKKEIMANNKNKINNLVTSIDDFISNNKTK